MSDERWQVLYSAGAPTDGVRLGQLLVDESAAVSAMLKVCTSLSPVTYSSVLTVLGGTFTGAVTFSANPTVALTSPQMVINDTSGTGTASIAFQDAGTTRFLIGSTHANGSFINDAVANDAILRTQGGALRISVDSGGSSALAVLGNGTVDINAPSTSTVTTLDLALNTGTGVGALFHTGTYGMRVNASGTGIALEGVDSTGTGSYQPLSIDGTPLKLLTQNVEIVQITTAGDVRIVRDSDELQLGAGNDLRLYHDGSHSYIKNLTGELYVVPTGAQGKLHLNSVSTTGIYLVIRPDSGKDGFLQFTEDGVADRWVIKSPTADSNLYLASGNVTSHTHRVRFSAGSNPLSITGNDSVGDCYMAFYENQAWSTRKGYFGYGEIGADNISLMNEENANIYLGTNSTVRVTIPTYNAINITATAGDPASPQNGDIWYNSSTSKFRGRAGGVSVDLH